MRRRLRAPLALNVLLILALLVLAVSPVLAQEEPEKATRKLWLPVVPILAPKAQSGQPGEMQVSPEQVSLEHALGVTKAQRTKSLGTKDVSGRLVSVIVKLKDPSLAAAEGKAFSLASRSSQDYLGFLQAQQAAFEATAEAAIPGATVVHNYTVVFGGVSMLVPAGDVDKVATLPGVVAVYPDELRQVDTERSPEFMGAPALWDQLGGQESAGEGVIVGVLDTGVWPEHASFSDPDPFGNPYPAPPTVPGSSGFGSGGPRSTCDFGDTAWNPDDAPFTCNNKLIGAYDMLDTYKAVRGLTPGEFDSARDSDGHGTHTMSTAAGNGGVAAEIFGVPRGTVSGIAPRAHVIMYRVCAGETGSCFESDSMQAVQQAVLDGVDVVNFSIGGGSNPYSDGVSLAFLDAFNAGVLVTPSAGNSGPGADTVGHREPWTLTVGASTSDRHFLSTVLLMADNGDTLELQGATVTAGIDTPTPVVMAADYGDGLCLNPFPAGTFSGEIVVCQRGVIARVAKSYNVAAGGAGGLLLYNPVQQGLSTDNHFIPSVHLENDAGDLLVDFMTTHTGVTATFTQGVATTVQGDVMAAFSSRGGSSQLLGISKPDVTAPGVQILAGHTPLPAFPLEGGGLPGQLFQAIQGTSMSAPHAAGSAALLKDLHPDWTPAEIKSALMLTANASPVVKEDGVTPADAYDMGSGRIDLAAAGDPGLTMDVDGQALLDHEEDLWNVNYPSLYHPALPGAILVERTVRNQSSLPTVWNLSVDSPPDLKVDIRPALLRVPGNGEATFGIQVDARDVPAGETRFATLYLQDASRTLRFPITIVKARPTVNQAVSLSTSCEPTALALGGVTDCTVEMTNNTFDDAQVLFRDALSSNMAILRGSVTGAQQMGHRQVQFAGTLAGAEPPVVTVVDGTGTTPAGYLPLSAFGFTPIAGVGDETIVNYNVPAFVYAGDTYTRIGIVSNGYAVVGSGTGADVEYINQILPDPAPPNNVLAPFWTDLNPSAGGALRIGVLTDGVNSWLILDWEDVPNWGDGELNNFQIWIGVNGVEDISFTYGDVSDGDSGFLTVGAENKFGNSGENWYADGAGTPVAAGSEVRVQSQPGAPGETHVVTFSAIARGLGDWESCAYLASNLFDGLAIACEYGTVE